MYDILIIGSGPAGLSAAIYAKRANMKVAVFEKEYEGTGQIAESQLVDNYLGLPGIPGYDLGERFRNHALDMGVEFIELEITALTIAGRCDDHGNKIEAWKLTGQGGRDWYAKTIIYAAGARPRRLHAKGEERFLGKGISFCAICDGAFYKNKSIAVIGGGDTALDDALYLSDIAKEIFVIHRRTQFRGAGTTLEKLKNKKNIQLLLNAQVDEFYGEKKISGIHLKDGRHIDVDGIFEAIGSVPQSDLLKGYADLNDQGYVIADESGITKSAGLFVAGDIREKKLRQVVTAVSDGANAAASAVEYINK